MMDRPTDVALYELPSSPEVAHHAALPMPAVRGGGADGEWAARPAAMVTRWAGGGDGSSGAADEATMRPAGGDQRGYTYDDHHYSRDARPTAAAHSVAGAPRQRGNSGCAPHHHHNGCADVPLDYYGRAASEALVVATARLGAAAASSNNRGGGGSSSAFNFIHQHHHDATATANGGSVERADSASGDASFDGSSAAAMHRQGSATAAAAAADRCRFASVDRDTQYALLGLTAAGGSSISCGSTPSSSTPLAAVNSVDNVDPPPQLMRGTTTTTTASSTLFTCTSSSVSADRRSASRDDGAALWGASSASASASIHGASVYRHSMAYSAGASSPLPRGPFPPPSRLAGEQPHLTANHDTCVAGSSGRLGSASIAVVTVEEGEEGCDGAVGRRATTSASSSSSHRQQSNSCERSFFEVVENSHALSLVGVAARGARSPGSALSAQRREESVSASPPPMVRLHTSYAPIDDGDGGALMTASLATRASAMCCDDAPPTCSAINAGAAAVGGGRWAINGSGGRAAPTHVMTAAAPRRFSDGYESPSTSPQPMGGRGAAAWGREGEEDGASAGVEEASSIPVVVVAGGGGVVHEYEEEDDSDGRGAAAYRHYGDDALCSSATATAHHHSSPTPAGARAASPASAAPHQALPPAATTARCATAAVAASPSPSSPAILDALTDPHLSYVLQRAAQLERQALMKEARAEASASFTAADGDTDDDGRGRAPLLLTDKQMALYCEAMQCCVGALEGLEMGKLEYTHRQAGAEGEVLGSGGGRAHSVTGTRAATSSALALLGDRLQKVVAHCEALKGVLVAADAAAKGGHSPASASSPQSLPDALAALRAVREGICGGGGGSSSSGTAAAPPLPPPTNAIVPLPCCSPPAEASTQSVAVPFASAPSSHHHSHHDHSDDGHPRLHEGQNEEERVGLSTDRHDHLPNHHRGGADDQRHYRPQQPQPQLYTAMRAVQPALEARRQSSPPTAPTAQPFAVPVSNSTAPTISANASTSTTARSAYAFGSSYSSHIPPFVGQQRGNNHRTPYNNALLMASAADERRARIAKALAVRKANDPRSYAPLFADVVVRGGGGDQLPPCLCGGGFGGGGFSLAYPPHVAPPTLGLPGASSSGVAATIHSPPAHARFKGQHQRGGGRGGSSSSLFGGMASPPADDDDRLRYHHHNHNDDQQHDDGASAQQGNRTATGEDEGEEWVVALGHTASSSHPSQQGGGGGAAADQFARALASYDSTEDVASMEGEGEGDTYMSDKYSAPQSQPQKKKGAKGGSGGGGDYLLRMKQRLEREQQQQQQQQQRGGGGGGLLAGRGRGGQGGGTARGTTPPLRSASGRGKGRAPSPSPAFACTATAPSSAASSRRTSPHHHHHHSGGSGGVVPRIASGLSSRASSASDRRRSSSAVRQPQQQARVGGGGGAAPSTSPLRHAAMKRSPSAGHKPTAARQWHRLPTEGLLEVHGTSNGAIISGGGDACGVAVRGTPWGGELSTRLVTSGSGGRTASPQHLLAVNNSSDLLSSTAGLTSPRSLAAAALHHQHSSNKENDGHRRPSSSMVDAKRLSSPQHQSATASGHSAFGPTIAHHHQQQAPRRLSVGGARNAAGASQQHRRHDYDDAGGGPVEYIRGGGGTATPPSSSTNTSAHGSRTTSPRHHQQQQRVKTTLGTWQPTRNNNATAAR